MTTRTIYSQRPLRTMTTRTIYSQTNSQRQCQGMPNEPTEANGSPSTRRVRGKYADFVQTSRARAICWFTGGACTPQAPLFLTRIERFARLPVEHGLPKLHFLTTYHSICQGTVWSWTPQAPLFLTRIERFARLPVEHGLPKLHFS